MSLVMFLELTFDFHAHIAGFILLTQACDGTINLILSHDSDDDLNYQSCPVSLESVIL